ncbi:Protein kinase domain protein [Cryptosporidium meleagridis]|uniref:Protein kinase domain protein n=1 Tax=Cryptosporidium meleagridis TaxID=93969 RepID=A0A2P4Z252_9CRYT|nr:Protein kinase domain protein [Cryptosporidium meleagridis]
MSLTRENKELEVESKKDGYETAEDGKGIEKAEKTVEEEGKSIENAGKAQEKSYVEKDKFSLESFEFLVPEKKKEKSQEEKRGRMRELFKVGNFIELVYNQEEGGSKGVHSSSTTSSGEQRLLVFSISNILGMGAYGIVVLADICSPRKKKSRNSITVEITDLDVKEILEKLDPRESISLAKMRTKGTGSARRAGGGGGGVGKKLAIKIVDLEANDTAELEDPLATARKETSIMSELQDCEQILKYYVTFSSDSFLYILMEYAEGGSLYGLYSKYGSFPEELLASVTQDVLKALTRIHGRKVGSHSNSQNYILHNDIKSANILLTENCVAKLADFGVSRKIKSEIKTNRHEYSESITKVNDIMYPFSNDQEVLGSPFWMAPEIILGAGTGIRTKTGAGTGIGEPGASDIWSLGITVLELAFGRIPWPNFDSLEELLEYILRSPPPQKTVREEIKGLFSQEFWDFIDSCLAKDPNQRKNANSLLKHPFILFKAKRPNSLAIFIQTISGLDQNYKNSKYYLQSIFNYVNHFFSHQDEAKVPTKFQSLSNQNLIKKISTSVSISRYFSRKRSTITIQNIPSLSNKSSKTYLKDLENNQKTINNHYNQSRNSKSSNSLFSPTFHKSDQEQKYYNDESSLLNKKVSLGKIHKCLDSSLIEFDQFDPNNPSSYCSPNSPPSSNELVLNSNNKSPILEKQDSRKSNTTCAGAKNQSRKKVTNWSITQPKKNKLAREKVQISFKKTSQNPINSHTETAPPSSNRKEKTKFKTQKSFFSSCCGKNAI